MKYQSDSGFVQKSDGIYNKMSGGAKVSDLTTYSKWFYDGRNHYVVLSDGTAYRYDENLSEGSKKKIDADRLSGLNSIYRRGDVILIGIDSTEGLFRQVFESHVGLSYDDYREVRYDIDVSKIVDGNDDTGTVLVVYRNGEDKIGVLKCVHSTNSVEELRFHMTADGVRSEIFL